MNKAPTSSQLLRILLSAKFPGSERSKERKFQGANWPGYYWPIRSEERANGPGSEKAVNRVNNCLSGHNYRQLQLQLSVISIDSTHLLHRPHWPRRDYIIGTHNVMKACDSCADMDQL